MTLTGLELESGTLEPSFNSRTYRYTAAYSFPEMVPPEGEDASEWIPPAVEKSMVTYYWQPNANLSATIEGGEYAILERVNNTDWTILFTGLGDSAVLVLRLTDKETLKTNDYRIRLIVTG